MYGRTDYDGVGVAGRFRIPILDGTPGILYEDCRLFPQLLRTNVGVVC